MDKHWSLIEGLSIRSRFLILGRRLHSEDGMRVRITDALASLQWGARLDALCELWSGYHDMLPYPFTGADVSVAAIDFLLDLMVMSPDLREDHGQVGWEIKQLLKEIPLKSIVWVVELVRRRIAAFYDHDKHIKEANPGGYVSILPDDDALVLHAVAPLPDEVPRAEAQGAVRELLALMAEDRIGVFHLAKFLTKLDPHGRVTPHIVAEKLQDEFHAPDAETVCRWGQFAGWYQVGSPAWRTIAIAACSRLAPDWSDDDRNLVFVSLRSRGMKSWTGTPGELHPRFQSAVDRSKQSLEEEKEAALRPYWEWRLKVAEHDLENAKKKLEEGAYL